MSKEHIVRVFSWSIAIIVMVLAVAVWAGERLNGQALTAFDVFPLLGLGAFSLMWTHYIAGSVRRLLGVDKQANKFFMKVTSVLVLFFILLHPGLLNFELQQQGFGLPPESFRAVYPEAVQLALTLGSISLLIFLAFELKRWFGKKLWWRFVEYGQILAMALIFYHGLTLGRELSVGWYRAVWYVYGVLLVAAIVYNYWYDKIGHKPKEAV